MKVSPASLLSHNSLPCVSLQLSFGVFLQPVSGAELLRYENGAPDGEFAMGKGHTY